jgi:pilus assembly protein Flp/PilA
MAGSPGPEDPSVVRFLRAPLVVLSSVLLLLLVPIRGPMADQVLPEDAAEAPIESTAPPAGDSTAIEYGLIAALVAVVIITGLTALGSSLQTKFESTAQAVENSGGGTSDPPESDTTESTASHEPTGETESVAAATSDFGDLGTAISTTTASSDFANGVFTFTEQAVVLNADVASDAPNVKLAHELTWTLTLLAAAPAQGPPPKESAIARMDFSFESLAWGIGGPVAQQDGVFEIEGPGGTIWGWAMEKNVSTGKLELTSTYGPDPGGFLLDEGGIPLHIQGVTFEPEEVLREVGPGPSFSFELPYGTPKDVTFIIRRKSHTVVPDLSVGVPLLPIAGQIALVASLVLAARMRRRRARA